MRKNILWGVSILLACAIVWMVVKTVAKLKLSNEAKQKTSVLLAWPIVTLDSIHYDPTLQSGPVVLILFNPDCDHCQYEAGQIKNSIGSFSNVSILMISSEPLKTIRDFSTRYGLNDLPNVTFCKIEYKDGHEAFGSVSFPTILIYGEDHKLIKEFTGETNVETILKYLQ